MPAPFHEIPAEARLDVEGDSGHIHLRPIAIMPGAARGMKCSARSCRRAERSSLHFQPVRGRG